MSFGRSNSKMAVGAAIGFFRVVFVLALLFFTLTILIIPVTKRDSPEFVIVVLTLSANLITAVGAYGYIFFTLQKMKRQE